MRASPCVRCPSPSSCPRWDVFCAWAAEEPPDPVKLRHIVARSAKGAPEGPAAPAEFPPLAEQAANLAGSLVTAALSGFKRVSAEEQERRLAICHGCEFFRDDRCLKCGCYLNYKTRLEAWHCPIGKW